MALFLCKEINSILQDYNNIIIIQNMWIKWYLISQSGNSLIYESHKLHINYIMLFFKNYIKIKTTMKLSDF